MRASIILPKIVDQAHLVSGHEFQVLPNSFGTELLSARKLLRERERERVDLNSCQLLI